MTREKTIKGLKSFVEVRRKYGDMQTIKDEIECFEMAIKALEVEPLTDIEQRIFLAAMSREENACKEVCADDPDGGVDLVAVCHRIERKVKRALWG